MNEGNLNNVYSILLSLLAIICVVYVGVFITEDYEINQNVLKEYCINKEGMYNSKEVFNTNINYKINCSNKEKPIQVDALL